MPMVDKDPTYSTNHLSIAEAGETQRSGYRPRHGLSIPAVTVLDEHDRVIEDDQRRLFRYLIQESKGADIIFGVGTTGEWNRIANGERQRLIWIETDEVARINRSSPQKAQSVEAWVGVTSSTRLETLDNLKCALDARADAAVIAPLSIVDLSDIISFFQREVSDLFDHHGRCLPIFLYDNADIAVNPRIPHIRTRDVKLLSRLPFISGIKVSASRRVLGNYTKGVAHFKDKGEFGIYVGNAMLIFQVFDLEHGLSGRIREYWNRYLLHNELPIGVVSGPANAMPREWQRAWRACYAGDERLMSIYKTAFERFDIACRSSKGTNAPEKIIACVKHALKVDGVITSDRVANGTPALESDERREFATNYEALRKDLALITDPIWTSSI